MRLFVAVDLDDRMRGEVSRIIHSLKAKDLDVNFTQPENLHFTLKFLGEVSGEKVPEIKEKLKQELKGFRPFRMSLESCGYFGSHNFIRILWIDVNNGGEEIQELARKMKVLDYIRNDDFEPKPHLTIGRVKGGRNRELLLREIESLKCVNLGEMDVKEVKLKKSLLRPEGPVYSDVEIFPLAL